jgi:hypothetical protein
MLLSRANLSVIDIALKDSTDPVLHQMHVEPDGSTVASDGSVLMAVSPVTERPAAMPEFSGEANAQKTLAAEGFLGVLPNVVSQARRDMPRGALGLELGFAALTGNQPGRAGVELTTTDLNRNLKVEGRKAKRRFPEWRGVLREGRQGPGGTPQEVRRVAVDRKALVRLLRALDAAAPDPENVVFLEIPAGEGAGLVLRARNYQTGQSVVGLAMSINTRGEWLPLSPWEEGIFTASGPTPAPKKSPARKQK